MVSFWWPWVTHNPGFKVTVYYKSNVSKTVRLGRKLLMNTNNKPYTIYRMVPLSVTLSDLWPGFQGHDIFRHWISQKWHVTRYSHSYYRTSIGSRMRSIEWWHFQWTWRTPNPVFKVTSFFEVEYLQNEHLRDSFYRTLIGNHTQSIEWYHFQWPWITSDPDFKVKTFCEVEYWKNGTS